MKKALYLILTLLLLVSLVACDNTSSKDEDEEKGTFFDTVDENLKAFKAEITSIEYERLSGKEKITKFITSVFTDSASSECSGMISNAVYAADERNDGFEMVVAFECGDSEEAESLKAILAKYNLRFYHVRVEENVLLMATTEDMMAIALDEDREPTTSTSQGGSVSSTNGSTTGSGNGGGSDDDYSGSGEFVATHTATIVIDGYGTIVLELYGQLAPITVANFEKLANEGFYNGLTFHRIMEGFMMQGGCPNGNGTGGTTSIKGEFTNNGVNNTLSHKRGVISMARAGGYPDYYYYDTGSCQFFIVHEDSEFLDGNYAAFGMVTSGLDVVDAICTSAEPTDQNGTIPSNMQPRIISVTVEIIGGEDKPEEEEPEEELPSDNGVAYTVVDNNTVLFGSYPQSIVEDEYLIDELNMVAGALPSNGNPQAWTDCNYAFLGYEGSYMWYIDIVKNGEKYRGVYFVANRPICVTDGYQGDFQNSNGYYKSTVYWFKYEPISWTFFDRGDGTALLISDLIIDSQEFYTDFETRYGDSGKSIYSNNYEYSHIREWLNDNFYNTAFDSLQKRLIAQVTVDNSINSIKGTSNNYVCNNTEDKVFLLSYSEALSDAYGFSSEEERKKKSTDYAKCQGVLVDEDGYSEWFLRSPDGSSHKYVYAIFCNGKMSGDNAFPLADATCKGTVPALIINWAN